jgi:hypothetical protein
MVPLARLSRDEQKAPLLLPQKHYRGEVNLLSRAAPSKSRRASDLPEAKCGGKLNTLTKK